MTVSPSRSPLVPSARLGRLRRLIFPQRLGLLLHDQLQQPATVGTRQGAQRMSSSKVSFTREITCVASSEWPPRSKKLS